MTIFNEHQQEVAKTLRSSVSRSDWTDWKWQVRNTIKNVNDFERVLGITFPDKQRRAYERTLGKFPMSVTPYYLSLIHI